MKTRCRGFTVIELLIVMAIVALTAGIVYAVLGPAREQGRVRVCTSNLHQIGRAVQMYVADHEGIDPVLGTPMTCAELGLPCALWPALALDSRYIKSREVHVCPSYHDRIPLKQRSDTYLWPIMGPDRGDPRFPPAVAERGPLLALVACDQHNGDLDWLRMPRWATKRALVLRLSQQVEARQIPARDNDPLYW